MPRCPRPTPDLHWSPAVRVTSRWPPALYHRSPAARVASRWPPALYHRSPASNASSLPTRCSLCTTGSPSCTRGINLRRAS
ncbi:hypothetical protein GUJ93_ZPchr0008g12554 [Zizania palustris]|uniref:Uncharacterized protein n=1 Tax=Zizania palustris TaxID=103762 RepID=A0A8J5V581_ZIZPA|nr:hypothetical protein GUJ93_ZPchr0008g12554 [Zizania palustris]